MSLPQRPPPVTLHHSSSFVISCHYQVYLSICLFITCLHSLGHKHHKSKAHDHHGISNTWNSAWATANSIDFASNEYWMKEWRKLLLFSSNMSFKMSRGRWRSDRSPHPGGWVRSTELRTQKETQGEGGENGPNSPGVPGVGRALSDKVDGGDSHRGGE